MNANPLVARCLKLPKGIPVYGTRRPAVWESPVDTQSPFTRDTIAIVPACDSRLDRDDGAFMLINVNDRISAPTLLIFKIGKTRHHA